MALFEMNGDSLQAIPLGTFGQLGLRERADIQRAVRANIDAITPGVKTKVLAEEFGDWAGANRRIDLLCVDENANLVVVELKRDEGAHMDLQALRYAAMISTMRFDQAVEAHRKYLTNNGSDADPEQAIREFLDIDEGPVAFTETVRIVLASANFSPELTTAVLWLNKQGCLDIRCVQMRPHAINSRVLLDIQQVVPLPEAEQYTVALREKSIEQERVRATTTTRELVRYDLSIGEAFFPNLAKRRLMQALVREAIGQGRTPEQIMDAIPWRRKNLFLVAPGVADEGAFRALHPRKNLRYFFEQYERFFIDEKTYVFSRAWGDRTLEAAENVRQLLDNADEVRWEETSSDMPTEVRYQGYTIRRSESGAIEIERDGQQVSPVIATLKELASQLGVSTEYSSGNGVNTQRLGSRVIAAIDGL